MAEKLADILSTTIRDMSQYERAKFRAELVRTLPSFIAEAARLALEPGKPEKGMPELARRPAPWDDESG